jgi:probable rRNA maturation factor
LLHPGATVQPAKDFTMVDTQVDDERWADAGIEGLADRAVAATLRHRGLDPAAWEIAVLACDDARIAALNAEFRGKPVPTNVLSWPSAERAAAEPGGAPEAPDAGDGPELGDLAIAFDTCAREAAKAGIPFADHVTHLLVHGTLHLLGYDHVRDADGDLMERIEVEILASLGIPDPY